MKFRNSAILALTLAVGVSACGKKDALPIDSASPTAATPMTSAFEVGDIDMGRHVGPDKKISDKTDDFAPTDTIYASIHTKGGSAPAQVMARWTFQDGKIVHEETQSVAGGVEADTEFHIVKAGGWPKGKYTVHILVDGVEVRTKDVTVK
jgi:hypothetical protein